MDEQQQRKAEREEARDLEDLIKVVGKPLAVNCARKHLIPNLVDAEQRGYWRA